MRQRLEFARYQLKFEEEVAGLDDENEKGEMWDTPKPGRVA